MDVAYNLKWHYNKSHETCAKVWLHSFNFIIQWSLYLATSCEQTINLGKKTHFKHDMPTFMTQMSFFTLVTLSVWSIILIVMVMLDYSYTCILVCTWDRECMCILSVIKWNVIQSIAAYLSEARRVHIWVVEVSITMVMHLKSIYSCSKIM